MRLFEIGNRFTKSDGERRAVTCAWTGSATAPHWSAAPGDVTFFDMKGVVERLCRALRRSKKYGGAQQSDQFAHLATPIQRQMTNQSNSKMPQFL